MYKDTIIKQLSMKQHEEGGYYSETYRSKLAINTTRQDNDRSILTSIFYMLTNDSPIAFFHKNESDIVHYFHSGSALTYFIIEPHGELKKIKLGHDILSDQHLQFVIKGGCWKATLLEEGQYGLLGEAVAPGFDGKDRVFATREDIQSLVPHKWNEISLFVKP